MSTLPNNTKTIDLLKWVRSNPNQPFDPNMVVSAVHTSDWQWQAVTAQMEDLRRQAYITKLKQDPWGSTYWTITASGNNYLRALERFEASTSEGDPDAAAPDERKASTPSRKTDDEWDAFISHASEDKDAIARPLAEALKAKGLRVWYDEFALTVGDSLRKKIDQGLVNSHFGIVILSHHFFEKHWPEQELNGLATREVDGEKVILPVWHGVSFTDVRHYSPTLADRIAVSTDRGLPQIIDKLLIAMNWPHNAFSVAQSLTDAIPTGSTVQPVNATGMAKSELTISLSADGTPPSQVLKLLANQPVVVSRVEYMMSNEVCIAADDVFSQGESLNIPINEGSLLKLWNTPRPDRNHYDHSGPAKLGFTISVDGKSRQYILPVQMEFLILNNTVYRKLVGSRKFYGG